MLSFILRVLGLQVAPVVAVEPEAEQSCVGVNVALSPHQRSVLWTASKCREEMNVEATLRTEMSHPCTVRLRKRRVKGYRSQRRVRGLGESSVS